MVAMIAMKSSVVVIVSVVVGFGTSLSAATATTTSTTLVQPTLTTTPHTRRGAAPSNTHRPCMAFVDTGPFHIRKQRQQLEHSGGHCRKTTAVFVERTTRRIPTPPGYTNGRPLPKPYSQRTHYKYLERSSLTFVPPLPLRSTRTTLWESNSSTSGGSGNLVASSDVVKTQLLSAFTNLGVSDQYDAVLTGLCAKILDSTPTRQRERQRSVDEGAESETDEEAAALSAQTTTPDVTLTDCLDLLQEMNSQRIAASPRSLMALIDSTVKAQDAAVMANVVSQCIRNTNGLRQYGMQQTDILPFPTSYTSKVSTPGSGNGKKTILERLEPLPNVPTDDRVSEIASAGAFLSAVGGCEVTSLVTADDSLVHISASALLTLLVTVTAVDNGYDLLQTASNFVFSQVGKSASNDKKTDSDKNPVNKVGATVAATVGGWQLPDKASLPLGLGTGTMTGSVVRGLTRLTTVDPEREAECEAAALYTAYVLGLPCYAFRPNALEASVLVVESSSSTSDSDTNNSLDTLLSPSGILRMLVWLMAAPAMESMTHAQLIMSDPREASGFLQRLEDYYGKSNDSDNGATADLFWTDNDIKRVRSVVVGNGSETTVRDDLLKWAYTEADLLLRANRNVVTELSNRLSSGAATIGDCVAVIEGW